MSSFILQTWQDGTVLSRQYDILEEKCDLFRLKGHQLHLSILFTRDKYEGNIRFNIRNSHGLTVRYTIDI
jgi:hypothetical protein